jgi:rhamnogalacturonyl hydrolase YesR
MFDYADLVNREDIRRRAIRMSDWECEVQMESGAVQGGTIDQPPTPAIFNTGQVIFGWVRAYEETRDRKYIESAIRAGKYLMEQQDPDGAWRKNLSRYASAGMESYTYNTRTAWALLVLSEHDGSHDFRDSAIRNIDHSLTKQTANGWFHLNCLSDPRRPLLHTIAYCIRGILEAGAFLREEKYIERARLAADAVMSRMEEDGSLAGRFDEGWRPAVKWGCLTGDAQMSIIWSRMYQLTGDRKYLHSVKKINRYLRSVQLMGTKNPDLYGGITGAYPLHGQYGSHEILNWAVKYFIDALLLEHSIDPGETF